MHILYLHQYFVPPGGAGGTRSLEMARRFVAAGHRVTLVTSDAFFGDTDPASVDLEGLDLRVIASSYRHALGPRARIAAFVRFAVQAIREVAALRDVDVVFATSTPLTIAIPGIFAKLWLRRPMVFEVRDLWPQLPIAIGALKNPVAKLAARALEQAAYASAAHIVALSPGMREGIERTTLRRRPVTIVSNACDFDVFAPRAGDADAFLRAHPRLAGRTLAIYAGTFGEINGVGYLVELAAHTRRIAPRVAFVLVGDGKERAATQTRVRALGLQDTVFFLDPVPKPELRRILAAATAAFSVFIDLPAMWANSANKFFDALASGTPVVINYGGWQADLLRETGAGLVLPSTPTSLAARRLATWLQGPESVRAAEATATLAARFDRDHLTARLLTLLEETAVGSPRSPRGGPDRGRSGRS